MKRKVIPASMTASEYRAHVSKPHQPKKKAGGCKAKADIEMVLKLTGLPYLKELRFHQKRKWRFDFAIPGKMIAVEYEGVYGGGKSRHTTVSGYSKDTEKYNAATALGWRVLRYTATNYRNLSEDLNEVLKSTQ